MSRPKGLNPVVVLEEPHPVGYTVRWTCEPPARDQEFVVILDEWNRDYSIRTIHSWRAAA